MFNSNVDEFEFYDLVNEGNELVFNNNHVQGVVTNVGRQELEIEGKMHNVNLITFLRPNEIKHKFKSIDLYDDICKELKIDQNMIFKEKVCFLYDTFKESIPTKS